jgi:hypothetical protein
MRTIDPLHKNSIERHGMNPNESKNSSTPRALLAVLCATLALLGVIAGAASAATPTAGDSVTISLGKKGGPLLAKGVKAKAIKPAKLSAGNLVLPVSDVSTPTLLNGQLVVRGGLILSAGKKRVKVQGLLVLVKGRNVSISAKVGSERVVLFTGRASANPVTPANTSVNASIAKLKLSSSAAKLIKSGLAIKKIKSGTLGAAKTVAKAAIVVAPPASGPSTNFDFNPPVPQDRPATAVDVTSATPMTFWPRDSFINYVAAGGGSTSAEAPATNGTPIDSYVNHPCAFDGPTGARSYSFLMPFVSGWWDAPSTTGTLKYSGTIRFLYPGHGINIAFSNPTVEFNGANSRVIVTAADEQNSKAVDLVKIPGAATLGGAVIKYDGTITADGNELMGGFYPPPAPFGCVQLGFSA